jgi:hypothetical protein
MKGPKTIALVVAGFVVLAAGFAFADTLTTQNTSTVQDETTSSSQATTTSAPTTTTTEANEQGDDHGDHPRSTVGCPTGTTFENHGAFVSSVAKSDEGHDKVVEAAHSDCGKPEHDANENEAKDGPDHDANDANDANDDHGGDHHTTSTTAGVTPRRSAGKRGPALRRDVLPRRDLAGRAAGCSGRERLRACRRRSCTGSTSTARW